MRARSLAAIGLTPAASLLLTSVASAASPPGVSSLRRTPVVEVAERAGPAVVNIAAEARQTPFSRGGTVFEEWQRYFERRPRPRPEAQSLGSGVIIDAEEGLVLTNEHVVAGAGDVTVTLADRRSFSAAVVGADPAFDIAVLQILDRKADLPQVELGTSSDLMIGEPLVAIGNPFGLANTVTTGVVSALHRVIEVGDRVYEDFVQTDAAINPGNSGGALLNIEGKLIGINTAIYSEGRGIGFAIPVDKARAIVQEVLQYGEVRPAFTGLVVHPEARGGAEVSMVIEGSPAAEAGMRPGDVIVDLGGQEVRDGHTFRQLERALVPGRSRKLRVQRSEAPLSMELKVAELPVAQVAALTLKRMGLEVEVDARGARIARVAPSSDAARSGIRRGDVLIGLAGRRLRSEAELEAWLAALHRGDRVSVVIGRGGRAYSLSLDLEPVGAGRGR